MADKWHIMTVTAWTLILLIGTLALLLILPVAIICYIYNKRKYDYMDY